MMQKSDKIMLGVAGVLFAFGLWSAVHAEPATRANDFLSSIGVNTKVVQGQNVVPLKPALAYLGVRNIREVHMVDMTGVIHLDTMVDLLIGSGPGPLGISREIASAHQLAQAGKLLSIEGPNEPNNFGVTYNGVTCGKGSTSWTCVAEFQRDLYAAVKADAMLRFVPVFGVSEVGAENDNQGLQWCLIPAGSHVLQPDGTRYCDFVNDHNYVLDGVYKDNKAWGAAQAYPPVAPFDGRWPEHGLTWRGHFNGYTTGQIVHVPAVTTETGWPGTKSGGGGNDHIQGVLALNVFLDQWNAGWRCTFWYEVADFGQPGWGFYDDTVSPWQPRPAATFLHNFTTILADNSSKFNPTPVATSLPGHDALTHELLLQKSTGPHEFVVWREAVTGSVVQSVNLGATMPVVGVYDPTLSPTPIATYSNVSSILVTLSDHPLIVEF